MRIFSLLMIVACAACGQDGERESPDPQQSEQTEQAQAYGCDDDPPPTWKICEFAFCDCGGCFYVCPDTDDGPCLMEIVQDWSTCEWEPWMWSDACPM